MDGDGEQQSERTRLPHMRQSTPREEIALSSLENQVNRKKLVAPREYFLNDLVPEFLLRSAVNGQTILDL
jgi:hypothetical protein